MRIFIDTNLWVYKFDARDPEKSRRVSAWLRKAAEEHDIVVSTQVLIELRAVLSSKLKPPISPMDIRTILNALSIFEVVSRDASLVLDAHELAHQEQLSWFDALIVEAAVRARCDLLCSEDFNHGQQFGQLTIFNPLKASLD